MKRKIISIILIITILVGILPNFGLLKVVSAVAEDFKGIVIEKGTYDETKNVFNIKVIAKNIIFSATEIPFKYPSDIVDIVDYTKYITNNDDISIQNEIVPIENCDSGIINSSNTSVQKCKYEEQDYIDAYIEPYDELDLTSNRKELISIYFKIKDTSSATIADISGDMFDLYTNEDARS